MKEVMTLYRNGQIKAFDPLRVFDVSEISQAFRHFSSKTKDESLVQVLPSQYDLISPTTRPTSSVVIMEVLGEESPN